MNEFQVTIQDSLLVKYLPEIQLRRIKDKFPNRKLSVIHVGAYDGLFDIQLSKQFKCIQIYSIEACPKNYKFLKRITKKHPKITTYNNCISNVDGKVNFYLYLREGLKDYKLSSQSNSLYLNFLSGKKEENIRQIQVKSLTMDSFCRKNKIERIDLLRINCEGGEYSIFRKGSSFDFLDKVNILHIFIHGKSIEFLNKKNMAAKAYINKYIKKYKFKLLYGYDLTASEKYPVGHIQQVWVKEDYE